MTITRLWQAGAEVGTIGLEWDSVSGAVASTTKAKTGTYSFRASAGNYMRKSLPAAISQVRCGFHVNHNGASAGDHPRIAAFRSGSTYIASVEFDEDAGTIALLIGSTTVATVAAGAFDSLDTWMHCGVDLKLAGSGGWFYFYVNGDPLAWFDGDTNDAGATVDGFQLASGATLDQWSLYAYFDDVFVEETTGESEPLPVPDYRYELILPNGNGTYNDWTGSDGNSTDNYLLVDERPHDGDTTYVLANGASAGLQESYAMGAMTTLPTGWSINSVIALAVAKETSAGSNQIKLLTKVGGSQASSAAMDVGTAYALSWDRRVLQPSGAAWDESAVNAVEIGHETV